MNLIFCNSLTSLHKVCKIICCFCSWKLRTSVSHLIKLLLCYLPPPFTLISSYLKSYSWTQSDDVVLTFDLITVRFGWHSKLLGSIKPLIGFTLCVQYFLSTNLYIYVSSWFSNIYLLIQYKRRWQIFSLSLVCLGDYGFESLHMLQHKSVSLASAAC